MEMTKEQQAEKLLKMAAGMGIPCGYKPSIFALIKDQVEMRSVTSQVGTRSFRFFLKQEA